MEESKSELTDGRSRARRHTITLVRLLREQLEQRGMSQGQLEARCGLSQGRLEHVFSHPSELLASEAGMICEVLGLSMTRMIELAVAATDREEAARSIH